MANVLFKRGKQAQLPAKAIDGAFYLAEDSQRLYAGIGEELVLLNRSVQIISSLTALTTKSNSWNAEEKAARVDEIYYITDANILAIWHEKSQGVYEWVQINPDHNTYITSNSMAVATAGTNGVTVTNTLIDNTDTENDALVASLTITGAEADGKKTIQVSAGTGSFTITGDTYAISSSIAGTTGNKTATISLGSDFGQSSSVTISGGDNVSIDGSANAITISANDWKIVESASSIGVNSDGKVTVSLVDNENTPITLTATDAAGYKLHQNDTSIVPLNGVLDVYSTSEVDEKFKDLNGLTYCGTIGTSSSNGKYLFDASGNLVSADGSAAPSIHNGDMFLVSTAIKYGSDKKDAKNGDLLIAQGTEGTNGVLTSVEWTYVPSGDDTYFDTTYSFTANTTDNSFTIKGTSSSDDEIPENVLKFVAKANSAVTVESASPADGQLTVTIGHAEVACENDATKPSTGTVTLKTKNVTQNGTQVAVADGTSFNAVSAITVNSEGHVTNVDTATYTIPEYRLTNPSVSLVTDTDNSSYVLVKDGMTKGDEEAAYNSGFKVGSDGSISVSADSNMVKVDLVWGSF